MDRVKQVIVNNIKQSLPDRIVLVDPGTEGLVVEKMPPMQDKDLWVQYIVRTPAGPRFFMVNIHERF